MENEFIIKLILTHSYSNEKYYLESPRKNLSEIFNDIALIQKANFDLCKHYEISVFDMCKFLEKYYSYRNISENLYSTSYTLLKRRFGNIKKISDFKKILTENNTYEINLYRFWCLYQYTDNIILGEKNKQIYASVQKEISKDEKARYWLLNNDISILKAKITLYEMYNGKLEKGYFSSLKYHILADKKLVILRADSGVCYICQMVSSNTSKEYFLINGNEDRKHFVNILVCGTTDEDFDDVIHELNENSNKYLQIMINNQKNS